MNTTTGKTAAIYCRISLDLQDGAGVARQERDCRELAAKHGFTVRRVYVDNSISAYSGARRPAFEDLLADVQNGAVDVVICWATDRLYRRINDLSRIISVIGESPTHGVPVFAVKSGEVDLSTADGRLYAKIQGVVAEHSSEKTAERVSAAARDRAMKGKIKSAQRPFGWQRDPDGGFVPHPTEAAAVVTAYTMLISGQSLSAIARWLNSEGFTGTSGGTFTQARVSEQLRQPRHGGIGMYQGKPLPDVANVDGALVDAATWWAAHKILTDPARLKRGPAPKNLIGSDLAVCWRCGGTVRASSKGTRTGTRTPTYACRPGSHVTVARSVMDDYLNQEVVDYLIDNRDVLVQAHRERVAAATGADAKAAQAALEKAKVDRKELAKAYADGALSLAAYTAANSALDGRVSEAEAALSGDTPTALQALLGTAARDIRQAWDSADVATKRAYLRELIDKIVVLPASEGPDRFDIHWREG